MQIELMQGRRASNFRTGVFVYTLLVCALLAAALPHGRARAENVVIPSGVSGLMTVEFTYTEADFVNAFGYVTGSAASPTYNELLNTSMTRIGRRVWQRQVSGGETFEFYLEANTAGLPGSFTHAFYSSNPSRNTTVDSANPEKILQPQQTAAQAAANVWVLRWEDKNTVDSNYDADYNDVIVVVRIGGDRDGDGLWDDWEENGIDNDYDGVIDLPLHQAPFSADPDERDVFVEIDWMSDASHNHAPVLDPACNPVANPTSAACSNSVVPMLEQAFAGAPGGPVHLHVDTGPGTPFDLSDGNPLGGGNAVPEVNTIMRPQDSPLVGANNDFDDIKAVNFDQASARRFVFHYALLGHKMQSCATFSGDECTVANAGSCATGNAEGEGNDLLVTLSTECNSTNVGSVLLRKQVGTIMHELGHNFGLGHGGRPNNVWSNDGYKPNYLSIMNYSFQFTGVGTAVDGTGKYVGGRFDYSRAMMDQLDESGLLEGSGIAGGLWDANLRTIYYCQSDSSERITTSAQADWDCSGAINGAAVATDINNSSADARSTLLSSDDWGLLVLNFQTTGNFADGERDPANQDPVERIDNASVVMPTISNAERCDGFDNDGDTRVDEGFNRDGDAFTDCVDSCATQPSGTTPTLTAPANVTRTACGLPLSAVGLGAPQTNACFPPEGRIVEVDGVPANIPLVGAVNVPAGVSTVAWSVVDAQGNTAMVESTINLSGASITTRLNQTKTLTPPAETTFVVPATLAVANNPLWLPLNARLKFTRANGTFFQCIYTTIPWNWQGGYAANRLNFTSCSNGAGPGASAVAGSVQLTGALSFGIPPIVMPEFTAELDCP